MITSLDRDIDEACRCLCRGGIILYPTDTIWGLGCDATDSKAVHRIFEIKQRAEAKALITLMPDTKMLEKYVTDIPSTAFDIIELSDSPITIIYDSPIGLSPELLAKDGSAGIRITKETYSFQLCRVFGKPIVSTSANISGTLPPKCFNDISDEIIRAADYTAKYRRNDTTEHKPSAVIKISSDLTVKIIRP